jgi:hypothetical protein
MARKHASLAGLAPYVQATLTYRCGHQEARRVRDPQMAQEVAAERVCGDCRRTQLRREPPVLLAEGETFGIYGYHGFLPVAHRVVSGALEYLGAFLTWAPGIPLVRAGGAVQVAQSLYWIEPPTAGLSCKLEEVNP